MEAIRGVILACVAVLGGCLSVDYTRCGDVYCATGEVCSPSETQCVFPEQIESCAAQAEGTFCSYTGVPIGACTAGVCVSQTTGQLPAPTDFVASDGTSSDHVQLSWARVEGATGYRVWRDSIAVADVPQPSYDDTGATTGGVPTTPANLSASQGTTLTEVQLGWGASSTANGAVHTYFVTALLDTLQSSPSPNDTGYRDAYPITNYQVSLDSGISFTDVGVVTGYTDSTAPVGTWSATVAATDGVAGKVGLSFAGLAEVEMPRTYFVRAASGAGPSVAAMTTGYRDVGSPTGYQWQWADTSGGTYTNLAGGTTASFDDTTGPVITPRFYRCVLTGANGATATLAPESGWRGLEVPTNVAAADGTSTAHVSLTWSPAFGATGYRVFRDGVAIADVTGTSHDDTGATAGAVPTTPSNPTASQGTSLANVQVGWTASTSANGATHTYTVRALAQTAEGPSSAMDTGYRAAYAVTGYELSLDAGLTYTAIGNVTAYTDAAAPVGTWTGNAVASDTTPGRVALALTAVTEQYASRSYFVRAVNGAGPSAAAMTSGYRDVGNPTGYQWQRASTSTGTYSNVTGGTTAAFDDTTGPVAAVQFYGCVLTGANGATATLGPDAGTRGIEAPTNLLASDGTAAAHVALTWNAVFGATGYRVYRGGVEVASVTATSYDDTGAPAGGAPTGAPSAFAASDGTSVDRVTLTWNAVTTSAGAIATYTVAATVDTTVGPLSGSNAGNRAAFPVSYELDIDSAGYTNIGASTSYNDFAASPGSYNASVTASDGKAGMITLTASVTTTAGATRTYTIRAVNAAGTGATTSNPGHRGSSSSPLVQWQRSASTTDGSYADISGATTSPYNDTTSIPTFEPRWFRAVVSAAGTTSVTSAPDVGWRGLSTTRRSDTWIVGGRLSKGVRAIARGNGVMYIGGEFTYVGPKTGTFSKIGAAGAGVPDLTWPRFSGEVKAAAPDGAGGWYVGGSINAVNDVPTFGVVRVTAAGTVDTTFNPGVINSTVNAIAVSGSRVYIGGAFTNVGGQVRNHLAALDATTGALVPGWNPDADLEVLSLAAVGGSLYIGGTFTTLGANARSQLGAADLTTGAVTTWAPVADGQVDIIQALGSTLYLKGAFVTINGTARNRLAAIEATTGVLTAWDPALNAGGSLRTMLVTPGAVYLSGNITTLGGVSRSNLAAVNTTTGATTSFNATSTASASNLGSMTLIGNTLYVGFGSTVASGQPRANIAAFDVTTSTLTSWNPGAIDWLITSVMVNDGTSVFVGSSTSSVGGVTRNNLVALDLSTGVPTSWNPNVLPTTDGGGAERGISAMAVSADLATVYIGGVFSNVGLDTRNRIAAVSASTGLATSWDPNAGAAVRALALNGANVYVGGEFTTIGGMSRIRIAEINASGAATAWNPGAGGTVRALAVSGTTVYAGGDFTSLGGQLRSRLGSVDTGTGVVTSWDPSPAATVRTIVLDGATLWVGGAFTAIAGQSRSSIASFDAATAALNSWSTSSMSEVASIAVSGNAVFFCGTGGVTVRDKLLPAPPPAAWSQSSPGTNTCSVALDGSRLYLGFPVGDGLYGFAP